VADDRRGCPGTAVLSYGFWLKEYGGRGDVVGKTISLDNHPFEILGVMGREFTGVDVGSDTYIALRENIHPTVYLAMSQDTETGESVTFELNVATGTPTAVISAVKSSIAEVNRDVSLQFKTLALQVEESLARERLLATFSGFFGGLALALSMIGLYGVMSYNVTRRRNEIGIRMALGAEERHVLRMVLGEVALLISVGVVGG
jgi:putative ABC transport system permease protein